MYPFIFDSRLSEKTPLRVYIRADQLNFCSKDFIFLRMNRDILYFFENDHNLEQPIWHKNQLFVLVVDIDDSGYDKKWKTDDTRPKVTTVRHRRAPESNQKFQDDSSGSYIDRLRRAIKSRNRRRYNGKKTLG